MKDKAAVTWPQSSYFICWTARSGSNLLSEALSATNVAGHPREYLPSESLWATGGNPGRAVWRQQWDRKPFLVCLANTFQHGSSPNGVFGMKVEAPNLAYLDRKLPQQPEIGQASLSQRLAHTFPDLRYIWITRRNKVRQAVSYFRAAQTEAWVSRANGKYQSHELTFNLQLIDQYLQQILRDEYRWAEFFAASGIAPFTVVYEDFVLEYEPTVRRVLDYLQIPLPEPYEFPPPRLQKQADELSEEWVKRYQEGMAKRHSYQRLVNLPLMLKSRPLRDAFVTPRIQAQRAKARRKVVSELSRSSRSNGE